MFGTREKGIYIIHTHPTQPIALMISGEMSTSGMLHPSYMDASNSNHYKGES